MKENVIIQLSDRDHILQRPNIYIGGLDEAKHEEFVINGDRIEKQEITYSPGLYKLVNEIIDNSIDEYVRTDGQYANKIDVKMDDKSVDVKDNGRGIPVVKVAGTNKYGPDIAFTEAKSGSNFNDDNRTTIGMNGVGSTCVNVFSKKFNVDTADSEKRFALRCRDNMEHAEHTITKSNRHYTHVYFEPDLERFGLDKLTDVYHNIIKQRLYYLSISYPGIRFTFNSKVVKFKHGKDLVKHFSETYEIIEKDDYFIAITPSDYHSFSFFTYVNGLYIKSGGNHIDFVATEVVTQLRDKLQRKYKGIKPGDIKNKIQIIMFMNRFPDARFSSQTKEQLTNSFPSIKQYLNLDDEEIDKFVAKIYRNKTLIDDITETFRVKEELKKRKELKEMSKTKKKLNIDKYLPPAKNQKHLVLCEGDSAVGGVSKVLGRDDFGYFALRGKPLNVYDAPVSKITGNKELYHITQILGLDLTDKNTDMDFENVIIATDADLDGILIRGLILTFFDKFAPKLVQDGRIKVLATPMITAVKKGVIEKYFMSFEDYLAFQKKNKGYEYSYYKGLGSWRGKEDLGYLIDEFGLDSFIEGFEHDDNYVIY
jgi:DNA gyrase/topoisomerase IV subunit B